MVVPATLMILMPTITPPVLDLILEKRTSPAFDKRRRTKDDDLDAAM